VKTEDIKMNVRLQHFLSAENITQAQFADTINVARASVSHILAGRNKPGYDFITGIMKNYPSLNIEWLLSGKGKMYKDRTSEAAPEPEREDLFSSAPLQTSREELFPPAAETQERKTESTEQETVRHESIQLPDNQRKISKILVFYDDNTFIELS